MSKRKDLEGLLKELTHICKDRGFDWSLSLDPFEDSYTIDVSNAVDDLLFRYSDKNICLTVAKAIHKMRG